MRYIKVVVFVYIKSKYQYHHIAEWIEYYKEECVSNFYSFQIEQ